MTSAGVPAATTSPPWRPAPGPKSTSQSASSIASRSCSTTTTRVADVAQVLERGQQLAVVALVQADRGLVEHVDDAGQLAADLAGQPDALALAARERGRRAGRASGSRGPTSSRKRRRERISLSSSAAILASAPLSSSVVEERVGRLHGERGDLGDRAARRSSRPAPRAGCAARRRRSRAGWRGTSGSTAASPRTASRACGASSS